MKRGETRVAIGSVSSGRGSTTVTDAQVLAAVEAQRPAALETIRFIHSHPELGHDEHACADHLSELLARAGLDVERGVAQLETTFLATLRGGRPGRSVGVVCLYDAVPAMRPDGSTEPVHSCGHGPIAGGVVAAALALASLREELEGTFAVVGSPADEIHAPGTLTRGGGKALMAAEGVWDGFDAALYAHPEFVDTVSLVSRWMRREHVQVAGTRSLSGDPQPPLRAAAALVAANTVDVMVERMELDGDVEEGTGLVLRGEVLVFADSPEELDERTATLRASLPEAEWSSSRTVEGVRPNRSVTAAVREAFLAAGRGFVDDPPPLPFATDFGNVSRRVPAALIGIGRADGWSFHTDDGAAEFASDAGDDAALALARVVALAAVRLQRPS